MSEPSWLLDMAEPVAAGSQEPDWLADMAEPVEAAAPPAERPGILSRAASQLLTGEATELATAYATEINELRDYDNLPWYKKTKYPSDPAAREQRIAERLPELQKYAGLSAQYQGEQGQATPEERAIAESKTLGGAFKAAAANPGAAFGLIAPSAASSLVDLPQTVAAGLTMGPRGAVAASGISAGQQDYKASVLEALGSLGYNTQDSKTLEQALLKADVLVAAQEQAKERAMVVGGAAGLGTLVGGKMLAGAVKPGVGRELANVGLQIPTQAAIEGGGEALAQQAAGQEYKPGEIVAEMLGGAVTAPADVAQAAAAGFKESGPDPAVKAAADKARADYLASVREVDDGEGGVTYVDAAGNAVGDTLDEVQLTASRLTPAEMQARMTPAAPAPEAAPEQPAPTPETTPATAAQPAPASPLLRGKRQRVEPTIEPAAQTEPTDGIPRAPDADNAGGLGRSERLPDASVGAENLGPVGGGADIGRVSDVGDGRGGDAGSVGARNEAAPLMASPGQPDVALTETQDATQVREDAGQVRQDDAAQGREGEGGGNLQRPAEAGTEAGDTQEQVAAKRDYGDRFKYNEKPLYEMTTAELLERQQAVKKDIADTENRILGDKADAYRRALRRALSENDATAARGQKEIDALGITPEQEAELEGDTSIIPATAWDEAQDFVDAATIASLAETPEQAADGMWRDLLAVGRAPKTDPSTWSRREQVGYVGLRALQDRIREKGWDAKAIQAAAIQKLRGQIEDADVEFMLERFLKPETTEAPRSPMLRGTSAAAPAPQPAAAATQETRDDVRNQERQEDGQQGREFARSENVRQGQAQAEGQEITPDGAAATPAALKKQGAARLADLLRSANKLDAKPEQYEDARLTGLEGEAIARLGALFNKDVVVFRAKDGAPWKAGGALFPSDPSTLFINADSGAPATYVFMHEMTHSMKRTDPETWAKLEAAMRPLLKNKDRYQKGRLGGKALPEAIVTEEMIADMMAENASNPQFWSDLYGRFGDKSAWAQFVSYMRSFLERAIDTLYTIGPSNYVSDLNKAYEALVDAAYNHARAQHGDVASNGKAMELPAYHGTPHEFDEFSLSKIGTGEGAQAYGWGLYFAENKNVAEGYKVTLSSAYPTTKIAGVSQQRIDDAGLTAEAPDVPASGMSGQEAKDLLMQYVRNESDRAYFGSIPAAKWKIEPPSAGSLYTVDIPDSAVAKMLDWDKPLSQQPESVQNALDDVMRQAMSADTIAATEQGWDEDTGQTFYARLVDAMSVEQRARVRAGEYIADTYKAAQQAASKALEKAGIPGIRYLDAGSRSAGDGSRNLVVFDDKLVRITHKNGRPVTKSEREAFIDEMTPQDGPALEMASDALPDLSVIIWKEFEFNGIKYDNRNGLGSVPDVAEITSKGAVTLMRPSQFLKLAASGVEPDKVPAIAQKIKNGDPVGMPFLRVNFQKNPPRVTGHEGRHRAVAIGDITNDAPFPVAVLGENYERRRDLIKNNRSFASGLASEDGDGPTISGLRMDYEADQNGPALEMPAGTLSSAQGSPPSQSLLDEGNAYWRAGANMWDNLNRVRILQDKAVQRGLQMRDNMNVWVRENLSRSKMRVMADKVTEDYQQPILDLMATNDLSLKQVDDYLYALHAPERNAAIAAINPRFPDGGSGMTNAEAASILAAFTPEQTNVLKQIAAKTKALQDYKLSVMEKYGLMEPADVARLRSMYSNYVPLKTIEEGDTAPGNTGRGLDIRGSEVKQALGRGSRATSPLLVSFQDMARTLVRAHKNEAGNALLELSRDPVIAGMQQNGKPIIAIANPADFARPVTDAQGQVSVGIPGNWWQNEEVFVTKENGVPRYIHVRDPELMAQLRRMGDAELGAALRAIGQGTRLFARMLTQYNPVFAPVNIIRDAIQASVLALGVKGVNPLKVVAAVPANLGRIMANKARPNQRYKEFLEDGASTNAYGLNDLQDSIADIEALGISLGYTRPANNAWDKAWNAINAKRKSVARKRAVRTVFDGLSWWNEAFENAVRLSTYNAMRDAGYTREEAAFNSKELSTNFNKKGQLSAALNAAYVFVNAAMQGNRALVKFWKESPKIRAAFIGLVAAGVLQDVLGSLFGGEDDESGLANLDEVGDWALDHNIVIPTGDNSQVKIPLPYGLNLPFVMGRRVSRAIRTGDGMSQIAGILNVALDNFSPIGGFEPVSERDGSTNVSGTVAKTISPSLLRPLVGVAFNANFMGAPIAKEPFQGDPSPAPRAYDFKPGTADYAVKTAEWLNSASGGNKAKPGDINVSPEHIQYLIGEYFGGAGRFVSDVTDISSKLSRGAEGDIDWAKAPFVRSFTGTDSRSDAYNRYREIRQGVSYLKDEKKAGEPLDPALVGVSRLVERTEDRLSDLRKRRKAAYAREDMAMVRQIQDQETALIKAVVKQYNERKKAPAN